MLHLVGRVWVMEALSHWGHYLGLPWTTDTSILRGDALPLQELD